MRTRVVVLGATGSIGRQAIEVIAAHPDDFELAALSAGSDAEGLETLARAHGSPPTGLGTDAAVELAQHEGSDVVLNAVVGAAGLQASLVALEAGKTLALANKESLVAGGELCLDAARRGGGRIEPVDSEHAAIAQCLTGMSRDDVARIVLTASGGPFRRRADLAGITAKEALAHPTWEMGPKITIDSATLMNKGLEVIEAHYLFGLPYERIGVLVHPQSMVHGIVELVDGSSLMQAAPADMRIPIQAALAPNRPRRKLSLPLDLVAGPPLEFEEADLERFPALSLARAAGAAGGTCPAVLNAANEEAVRAFLDGAIPFTGIVATVEAVLAHHEPSEAGNLDQVLEVDRWARRRAQEVMRTPRAPINTQ
ncbi:MAG: 1-deoxy-D-xylulose-5-phosphate reductoisomerase [Actinomycetota bacterium]